MNIAISKRLMLSASMVSQGAAVADIGCDHGYLGIYLLQQGIAAFVFACDLREMPLASAMRNAEKYDVADKMEFVCADGLTGVDPGRIDTIVCAGMGGDLIQIILSAAPWIRNNRYTLILQPQSGAHELRRWLYDGGFEIERECAVQEGHVYFAMRARFTGKQTPYTPGSLFVTPQMRQTDCDFYIERILQSVRRTLEGLRCASAPGEKLAFYEAAYREISEMKKNGNQNL